MATARKTGGAKTTRSETVTVRLDPELRYLADIAARIHRRTLSSYVEWAIIKSLDKSVLYEDNSGQTMVSDMAAQLWDVEDADRFAKLAIHAPHLLNYDEQRLWKIVSECGYFWRGNWVTSKDEKTQRWEWGLYVSTLKFSLLRKEWDKLNAIINDELDISALPAWEMTRNNPNFADDIPF